MHCQRLVCAQFLEVTLSRKSSVIVCVKHKCVHACVYVCVCVCSASLCTPYVTGFWKTDEMSHLANCFLLAQLIATHTLSMHCCNTRLSCLVCFSRADFADHVKSQLRQWDPWKALDGSYGSDIHPCVSETSHRPSRLVKAYE